MTKDELINECLKMPDAFLDYPFNSTTAVIKNSKGKMTANDIKPFCRAIIAANSLGIL